MNFELRAWNRGTPNVPPVCFLRAASCERSLLTSMTIKNVPPLCFLRCLCATFSEIVQDVPCDRLRMWFCYSPAAVQDVTCVCLLLGFLLAEAKVLDVWFLCCFAVPSFTHFAGNAVQVCGSPVCFLCCLEWKLSRQTRVRPVETTNPTNRIFDMRPVCDLHRGG